MERTRRVLSLALCLAAIIQACGALEVEVFKDSKKVKSYSDDNAYPDGRSANIVSTIRGVLIYPEPRNACLPVKPIQSNHTSYFALIVDYSACPEFSEEYLLNAGFKAFIALTNSSHRELLGNTGLPQALIKSQWFGNYLKNHAVVDLSGNVSDVYVKLSELVFPQYEELFIIFGSILFAAVVLSIVIFCCSICCRAATVKWRRRGLSRWRVSQLPKRKYRKSRETCESCSICLEEFREGDNLRVLPCDHVFHPSCVDEWLQKWNRVCPLCKSTIQRRQRGANTQSPESAASPEHEDALLLTNEQPQAETEREGDGYGAVGFSNPLLSSGSLSDSDHESQLSGRVRRSRSRSQDPEHRTMARIEMSLSPGAIRGDGRSSSEVIPSFGEEDSNDEAVMV